MLRVSHVLLRGSIYHFRVRVPTRLRSVVRRTELTRSLGTSLAYVAQIRSAHLFSLTESLWQALASSMTPAAAKALIDTWLQTRLDEDAYIRNLPRGHPHRIAILRPTPPWLPDELVRTLDEEQFQALLVRDPDLSTLYGPGEFATTNVTDRDLAREGFEKQFRERASFLMQDDQVSARPVVTAMLAQAGIDADAVGEGFEAAVRILQQANLDLVRAVMDREEAAQRRWSGDDPAQSTIDRIAPATTSLSAPALPQPGATPPAPTGIKLSDAARDYVAESVGTGAFKSNRGDEVLSAVKTLVGWLGVEPDVADITPQIAGDFRKEMSSYPVNGSKLPAYRDLSVKERIAKSRLAESPRPISPATLNGKYMDPLRGLYNWAIETAMVPTNPFVGIKIRPGRKPKKAKPDDFTVDQFHMLFGSTVFTGSAHTEGKRLYRAGTCRVDDWRYWLPLTAMFSGARLNELCGLQLENFSVRDGVDIMHIQEAHEDQSIKSDGSERIVPVHPELIRLGLMERVKRLRGEGETALYPALRPGPRGYMSDQPSKFFGRLIDRMIGKEVPVVFHSFRHTFISGLRRARIEREVRTALVGHEEGDSIRRDVHDGYGVENFSRLVDAVRAVEWAGLDLSAVRLPTP
jgi:integrase